MKQLITTLILILIFGNVNAQIGELCDELLDFKTICEDINKGIVDKNVSGLLDSALDKYDAMKIFHFGDDELIPENVEDEVSIVGHIIFTGDFVDSLLIYGTDYQVFKIDKIEMVRGASYDCIIANKAVKPFGKLTYKVENCGEIQIFVAAELGGKINLRIEDKSVSEIFELASETGEQMRWICFDKQEYGEFFITVENKTDKEISFVLASN